MKEQKRVPKLRFAEFVDDYLKLEFSEIASRSKKTYNPNKDLTNYKCVELESLTQVTGELIKTFDSIELKSNKTKFEVNDVLYGKLRPYLKKYWLATFEGVCTSEIWVLKGKAVKNTYLFQLIQTDKFNYEANLTTGSKMPRADWEYISSIKYAIPTLPEQLKIASFLSAFDKKIAQLQQKKRLLEDYKKGVMQQIFSQELRFTKEDGSAYPDWEEKPLSDFTDDFIVPMRDKPKKLDGNTPWCRIEDFDGKYLSKSKTNQGVSSETIKEMNLKVYPVGTLLVSCSANLGFCAIVKKELITNQTFIGLVPNKQKVSVDYLYHVMRNSSRKLNSLSSGTTISYLSRKEFEKFKIQFPCLEEQFQISGLFDSLDKKIAVVQTQIEKTQTFKKGLLQQMFV